MAEKTEQVEPGSDTRVVLSALGMNRPGIVASITATLANANADIEDIRQSSLRNGIFSMVMLVTLDETTETFDQLQDVLTSDAERLGIQITLQREDVYKFMYHI